MATMNLWLVKKIPDRRSGDVVALLSNWVSPRLSESPPPLPPGSEFRKPADGRFCTDRRSREQQQQPPPSLLRKAMPTTMPMQVAADRTLGTRRNARGSSSSSHQLTCVWSSRAFANHRPPILHRTLRSCWPPTHPHRHTVFGISAANKILLFEQIYSEKNTGVVVVCHRNNTTILRFGFWGAHVAPSCVPSGIILVN